MLHNAAEQIQEELATRPPVLTDGRATPNYMLASIIIAIFIASDAAVRD